LRAGTAVGQPRPARILGHLFIPLISQPRVGHGGPPAQRQRLRGADRVEASVDFGVDA